MDSIFTQIRYDEILHPWFKAVYFIQIENDNALAFSRSVINLPAYIHCPNDVASQISCRFGQGLFGRNLYLAFIFTVFNDIILPTITFFGLRNGADLTVLQPYHLSLFSTLRRISLSLFVDREAFPC